MPGTHHDDRSRRFPKGLGGSFRQPWTGSRPHTLRELREMSREELVEHHDQSATHTLVGVNYYLGDLRQGLAG
jgi:hypothetical protein